VKPSREVWYEHWDNIDTNDVLSVSVNGAKLDAIEIGDNTLSNVQVQNYTYDKNNNMVVDIIYQDTKSETVTEKEKTELEELESKNELSDEETQRLAQLRITPPQSNGTYRITLPSKNKRRAIKVPREDEAKIAESLGATIQELRNRAFIKKEKSQSNPNQEVDELGVPIIR
jgi:hypothetical protein